MRSERADDYFASGERVTSPMPIFQLNPSGRMTGSMVRPMVPARLSSIRRDLTVFERQVRKDP